MDGTNCVMYNIYLPMMQVSKQMKGVALCYPFYEDIDNLNCKWFYNWGNSNISDSRYVPMCWSGNETPTRETGYCLFLNEPENPSQASISPTAALERLKVLKDIRPNLKLIVGGCGLYGQSWMDKFRDLIVSNNIQVNGYHVHGYTDGKTLQDVKNYWTHIKNDFQGEIWITEFADPNGMKLPELLEIINDLQVDRYAYFTNRIRGTEINQAYPSNWPKPERISLFTWEGEITERGNLYKGAKE